MYHLNSANYQNAEGIKGNHLIHCWQTGAVVTKRPKKSIMAPPPPSYHYSGYQSTQTPVTVPTGYPVTTPMSASYPPSGTNVNYPPAGNNMGYPPTAVENGYQTAVGMPILSNTQYSSVKPSAPPS